MVLSETGTALPYRLFARRTHPSVTERVRRRSTLTVVWSAVKPWSESADGPAFLVKAAARDELRISPPEPESRAKPLRWGFLAFPALWRPGSLRGVIRAA